MEDNQIFFFDICTWPKSPDRTKFWSRFQFEGKKDIWISQVKCVKWQIVDQHNKPNINIPLYVGNKLKSWPLYLFVSISVFLWVAMTLYQDKIDEFCLNKFEELEPLYESIYVCIQNFLYGFSLFMILVLLAHLSDIENRSGCLVFFC